MRPGLLAPELAVEAVERDGKMGLARGWMLLQKQGRLLLRARERGPDRTLFRVREQPPLRTQARNPLRRQGR